MAELVEIPGLDAIAAQPSCVESLPAAVLAALSARCVVVMGALATAQLALTTAKGTGHQAHSSATQPESDEMLTPVEAAEVLRKSPRWIYRHAATLPFVKRVSARSLLCSRSGLERWLERRKP